MHCMDKQTYSSNKNFALQLTFKLKYNKGDGHLYKPLHRYGLQ